jgi:hypothetical protein
MMQEDKKEDKKGDVARKFDASKVPLSLLPTEALMQIGDVFGFGAQKYDAWNWTNGFEWSRLNDSLLRHILAWKAGEDVDPESGKSHLAHAGCNIMMLIWHEVHKKELDNRVQ